MPLQRTRKRRSRIINHSRRKPFIQSRNIPRHNRQLLLPRLPAPVNNLNLIRLKIMDLNRDGGRIASSL